MADANPIEAGKPRSGFLGWLADRTSIEMSFVYFFWLVLGANIAARLIVIVFPSLVTNRRGDSFQFTRVGGTAFVAMVFGPIVASVIFRAFERSRLRRAGAIAEAQPLVDAHGEPNVRRFGYLFWRSGCGALASIALYFCLTPFVLWFYVFAVRMADPGATILRLDSPYFWGAAALIVLPVVLFVLRWLAYRAETTAGFREMPKPKMRPMRPLDRIGQVYVVLLLLAMGSIFLYAVIAHGASPRGVVRALRSASWPTVDGVVISSGITEEVDATGRRVVRPAVRYTYEIPERGDHVGSELRVTHGWMTPRRRGPTLTNEVDAATAKAAQYPVGARVRVSYDPRNPASAVLEPGVQDLDFVAPMLVVAVTACALGLLYLAWGVSRQREAVDDEDVPLST